MRARNEARGEWGTAAPLSEDEAIDLFDTIRPTREAVEERLEVVFDILDRGECVYPPIYDDQGAAELLFAGYSYD